MVNFENKGLLTLAGGATVLSAVMMKNGMKQAKMDPIKFGGYPLGKIIFIVGWMLVAFSMTGNGKNIVSRKGLLAIVASASIVLAVNKVMEAKDKGMEPEAIYGMMFILGWVAIGLAAAGNNNMNSFTLSKTALGLGATGAVLLSMTYILPIQRKDPKVIDGPGMPLFTIAWFLLAAANSLKN